MEAYIKYKQKQRPLTSKIRENQYTNNQISRPQTGMTRNTSALNKDLKSKNIGNDMKSYRLGRPQSAAKDQYFGKFWEDTSKKNVIHSSSSKLILKSGEKNQNQIVNQVKIEESRKLYNYDRLEWDQKKNFNFLTNVGGLDLNRNNFNFIFDNTNTNSTLNTDKFNSRPGSAYPLPVLNNNDRPFTATQIVGNIKKPRIQSGLTEIILEQKQK